MGTDRGLLGCRERDSFSLFDSPIDPRVPIRPGLAHSLSRSTVNRWTIKLPTRFHVFEYYLYGFRPCTWSSHQLLFFLVFPMLCTALRQRQCCVTPMLLHANVASRQCCVTPIFRYANISLRQCCVMQMSR